MSVHTPIPAQTGASIQGAFPPDSLRRQILVFAALNLGLIVVYTAIKLGFAFASGVTNLAVFFTLGAGFAVQAILLLVLALPPQLSRPRILIAMVWASVLLNSGLVAILSTLTRGQDNQYYILMVLPVLEAAFTLDLYSTIAVILIANFFTFFSIYTLDADEYIEAGASSLIHTLMGVIVWLLVNHLRQRERQLRGNLKELEETRERLLAEEKLAAVGRLSSAIAHEIRNPVAMISSSLATAARLAPGHEDRDQMFSIAANEAARLERLTSDFLAYARPRVAQSGPANVADLLGYVATVAAAYAAERGAKIVVNAESALEGCFDLGQIQQALLNLVLNALEAGAPGAPVILAARNGGGILRLEVSDSGGPIAPATTARIFEPFFTTKSSGSGLGLAIARNIARAHGGDLRLTCNEPGQVTFALELPQRAANGTSRP
ncbi:MAG TPA: ATP-binding protein [Candidatus Binataceae bacterium]|nr:ATP-binding protein [Candidatus Binataceae bacterium]